MDLGSPSRVRDMLLRAQEAARAGVSPERILFDGSSPLCLLSAFYPTYEEASDAVRGLVSLGCDINIVGARGDSPLAVAAKRDNAVVARALLEHGAQVAFVPGFERLWDAPGSPANTALKLFVVSGATSCLAMLLRHNHPSQPELDDALAHVIKMAAKSRHDAGGAEEQMQLLLAKGADVHSALRHSRRAVALYYLAKHASVAVCADFVRQNGQKQPVDFLLLLPAYDLLGYVSKEKALGLIKLSGDSPAISHLLKYAVHGNHAPVIDAIFEHDPHIMQMGDTFFDFDSPVTMETIATFIHHEQPVDGFFRDETGVLADVALFDAVFSKLQNKKDLVRRLRNHDHFSTDVLCAVIHAGRFVQYVVEYVFSDVVRDRVLASRGSDVDVITALLDSNEADLTVLAAFTDKPLLLGQEWHLIDSLLDAGCSANLVATAVVCGSPAHLERVLAEQDITRSVYHAALFYIINTRPRPPNRDDMMRILMAAGGWVDKPVLLKALMHDLPRDQEDSLLDVNRGTFRPEFRQHAVRHVDRDADAVDQKECIVTAAARGFHGVMQAILERNPELITATVCRDALQAIKAYPPEDIAGTASLSLMLEAMASRPAHTLQQQLILRGAEITPRAETLLLQNRLQLLAGGSRPIVSPSSFFSLSAVGSLAPASLPRNLRRGGFFLLCVFRRLRLAPELALLILGNLTYTDIGLLGSKLH